MIICQYLIFNHNSFVWRAQNQRFSNVSAAWNSLISSLFPLICNFSNVKRGINNMQPTVSLWQGVRMVSHRELLSARRLPVWEKIYLINDHRHNLRNAMKNFYFIFCSHMKLYFRFKLQNQVKGFWTFSMRSEKTKLIKISAVISKGLSDFCQGVIREMSWYQVACIVF